MKLNLVTKTLSVRQTRRQSSCLHPGIDHLLFNGDRLLLYTTWVVLLAITLLASCSRSAEHGFRSSEEAIKAYADFFQTVKNTESITTDRLVELTRQWYALDDSVASCITRDSMAAHASARQEIIHDSLRFHMGRLIDKRQWTFTDYLTIIESLNRVETDTVSLPLVASAHRFYAGLSIDFDISINVPQALKVWYNIMLYLAYAGILWGLVLIVILYGSITDNMIETFNNCSFAIIAALIATRGWLMAEEQVMKKISNYYTFIICILITLIMTLSFMYHAKLENTSKLIQDNRNNELSIPIDSVVNDIHNNINAKVNDTLNNIGNIKFKVCDSLQIKNQNKSKTSESTKKKSGN